MSTGFIYVIRSVGANYRQADNRAVPTDFEGRIYFGPCKRAMRPKMQAGDYVFGLSPSRPLPRRLVFATRIAERMTFGEAYERYPKLHGPSGPIHVRPARMPTKSFPDSLYDHIPGANHEGDWRSDIRTPDLDAFFVCEPATDCLGRWLGAGGPVVCGELMEFLRGCSVHGRAKVLSPRNDGATESAPIRHGRLYTGLHLETDRPQDFLKIVRRNIEPTEAFPAPGLAVAGDCGRPTRRRQGSKTC